MEKLAVIAVQMSDVLVLAIDWGRVGKSALIGGVVGGLIGLVIALTKKKDQ